MRKVLPDQQVRMEASRWIDLQVLLSAEEMQLLLQSASSVFPKNCFYQVGAIIKAGMGILSPEDFLKVYSRYVEGLIAPNDTGVSEFRPVFSSAWSVYEEALYRVDLSKDQELLRAEKPVIQLQWLRIFFSPETGNFYPMSKGQDFISWGIQFSYPQLYWDPQLQTGRKVDQSGDFPNSALFKFLQKWLRDHTLPTPFVFQGQKKNIPARLGRGCISWINAHPDLIKMHLRVET